MEQVEQDNQARKQELYLKQQNEEQAKRERKAKAEQDLRDW